MFFMVLSGDDTDATPSSDTQDSRSVSNVLRVVKARTPWASSVGVIEVQDTREPDSPACEVMQRWRTDAFFVAVGRAIGAEVEECNRPSRASTPRQRHRWLNVEVDSPSCWRGGTLPAWRERADAGRGL
jgi:hypothetical protein